MSLANRLWGAPRIHGELLKIGVEVAQSTVAKYMAKRGRGRSQTWKTFLQNHAAGIAATKRVARAPSSLNTQADHWWRRRVYRRSTEALPIAPARGGCADGPSGGNMLPMSRKPTPHRKRSHVRVVHDADQSVSASSQSQDEPSHNRLSFQLVIALYRATSGRAMELKRIQTIANAAGISYGEQSEALSHAVRHGLLEVIGNSVRLTDFGRQLLR